MFPLSKPPTLTRREPANTGPTSKLHSNRKQTRVPFPDTESISPTITQSGLSALKILALTFLKQIELLEAQLTNNEGSGLDLQEEVRRFEVELIRSALMKTGGRQRRAASLLGMKVTTLNTKIKRYKITINAMTSQNDSAFRS